MLMSGYCMKCMEPLGEDQTCSCNNDHEWLLPQMVHRLPPGTMLAGGRYLLGGTLGQGGFGITYIGRDLTLNLRVAIKEYYPTTYVSRNCEVTHEIAAVNAEAQARLESGRRRFLDEARVLGKFHSSAGVVDVRDFFEENETAYIVMDYLEGETLKSHLLRKPFGANQMFELMLPILDALELIHAENVIHRDITPDNIMLCSNGKLCLMDFGAAHELDYSDDRTVSMVLKSGYAPEEQYRARGELGPWTDIYALCATMYRAITGIAPDESLQRIISDEMAWPSDMGIDISPIQEHVLKKGMAPRSSNRYQNIAEMKRDLAMPDEALAHSMATALETTSQTSRDEHAIAKTDELNPKTASTTKKAPRQIEKTRRSKRGRIIAAIVVCAFAVLTAWFVLAPAYIISFDTAGGSSIDPIAVSHIGTVDQPTLPVRDGYEFSGWYLDDSLSTEAIFPLSPNADTTLYAAWTKTQASYRVEYLDASNSNQIADAKVVDKAEVGATVKEKAPDIEGYALESKGKIKLTISENDSENVMVFQYRKLVTYEVRYRNKSTDSDVAPSKTIDNVTEGQTVTEAAPEISGYTLQSEPTQTLTLKRSSKKNVLVFFYEPIPIIVEPAPTYYDGGSGGGGSGGGSSSRSSGSNDVKWAN